MTTLARGSQRRGSINPSIPGGEAIEATYWQVAPSLRVKQVTMYHSDVIEKRPRLKVIVLPDKEYILSTDDWNKGEVSHYDKLNEIFNNDLRSGNAENYGFSRLNDGYPTVWVTEKKDGIEGSGFAPKHLVFGIIDRKMDETYTYFVGVVH